MTQQVGGREPEFVTYGWIQALFEPPLPRRTAERLASRGVFGPKVKLGGGQRVFFRRAAVMEAAKRGFPAPPLPRRR
jgi:hypothetical protein